MLSHGLGTLLLRGETNMINIATMIASAALLNGAPNDVTAYDLIMNYDDSTMSNVDVTSSDSSFDLNLTGFVQFDFSQADGGSTENRSGFDVHRARIGVGGSAYNFDYAVSGEWSDNDFSLKDAYVSTDVNGFDIKAGQFVTSFYNGYVSDPSTLTTGEYTISALTFGQGRSQGIELGHSFGDFMAVVSYNDGFNSDNISTSNTTIDNDYGVSGRLVYSGIDSVTLGAAWSNQNTDTTSYDSFTVDAGFSFSDIDFTVAYVAANWNDSWNNYSVVGNAVYSLDTDLDLFGQYEYGVLEGSESDLSVATVGVNYHINSNVRWTNSVGYAFDGIDNGYTVTDTGWEHSADSGQYMISSMIQITF
jgi:hypothetical protein